MSAEAAVVTAADVLAFLGDRVRGFVGDTAVAIRGAAGVAPGQSGCVSFAKRLDDASVAAAAASGSSLLLVPPALLERIPADGRVVAAVDDPRREFARVVDRFLVEREVAEIHPAASIHPGAVVGEGTSVGPGAVIADRVVVGRDCTIGPNAVILSGTTIGDRVMVGPNTTIGHTGFGYVREDDGLPLLMPHTGGVVIGDDVEIGANTCVDRGTLDDTVIENFAKIDNLVHVAHNCHIEHSAFVIATAILCGGVRIGQRAWVAPNVSIREQLTIGADATIGLASTVVKNVPDGATVVGSPAREINR